jgi:tyrosyl-DNA phosphodiesterase 2
MFYPKLPHISNRKSAHLLVRKPTIPQCHTRYSISNRRLNHSTTTFPVPEYSPAPQILNPRFYYPKTRDWRHSMPSPVSKRCLNQGSLLRVVSWNIDSKEVGRAARASFAMDYLENIFRDASSPLVIMLQEVHRESLSAIVKHQWVRDNFAVSNVHVARNFTTTIMVSQYIQTDRWFRIPLRGLTDRDLLAVDIPISSPKGESEHTRRILRLCTTHLDLFKDEGKPNQLAQVSALLKAPPTRYFEILAGLVGSNLNQDCSFSALSRKAGIVDLCDVWDDTTYPPTRILRRPTRNTKGYRKPNVRSAKRIDNFLYTGMIDAGPLSEVQDVTGRAGRLGIGLKTTVRTGEYYVKRRPKHTKREHGSEFPRKSHSNIYREGGIRKELDVLVSSHVGSAIGIWVR